jgi:hypothetical protein
VYREEAGKARAEEKIKKEQQKTKESINPNTIQFCVMSGNSKMMLTIRKPSAREVKMKNVGMNLPIGPISPRMRLNESWETSIRKTSSKVMDKAAMQQEHDKRRRFEFERMLILKIQYGICLDKKTKKTDIRTRREWNPNDFLVGASGKNTNCN